MSPPVRLTAQQIAMAMLRLPEWNLAKNATRIQRSIKFHSFNDAFGFMTRVALHAEKCDHHPNWSNVYNNVDIELWTHDVSGISQKDVEMALFIDSTQT